MSENTENVFEEIELEPTDAELRHREAVALWRAYYDAAEAYDRSRPHWPTPPTALGGSRGVLPKDARPNAPRPEPVEHNAIALVGSYTASARAAREGLEEHELALEPCACGTCIEYRSR